MRLKRRSLQALPMELWTAPRLRDLNVSMNMLSSLPGCVPQRPQGEEDVGRPRETDPTGPREGGPEAPVPCLRQDLHHHSLWRASLEVVDAALEECVSSGRQSQLSSVNLSHNAFECLPPMLACCAGQVSRLNLSYNALTAMGPLGAYPVGLRHLDLSSNRLATWPPARAPPEGLALSGKKAWGGACPHRRHSRLENLRTLALANNQLHHALLSRVFPIDPPPSRGRLLFPNLSMLDVSNNALSEVPVCLSEHSAMSVLNLSGNPGISHLPPELGLLGKLWNLNLRGCSLQDRLRCMVDSRKYKTMDIVGYLKSILEDAKPYARMKLMIVGVQGIGKTSLLEQLRQEGTGTYRRKPPEHWGKRMGHKTLGLKTPKGVTLSTVGVDVGDWVYEKKGRSQGSHGPVTFRTWDFGGQREYYTTHQYFLSKRSLYLVVWRMTDGERGVKGIHQWLINIQARAPNSPVIIVGTHQDLVQEALPAGYSEELQGLIRERFIQVVDADKCGLPRVLDSVAVSCRTRHNIRHLCNLIYDVVFDLRCPGSKERLLEQRIPATYLALEDVVAYLAVERRLQGKDPVLHSEQYRMLVMHELQHKFDIVFRDMAELNQATAFLHDNGVLLHYEDSTLKDLYFLDPQWLCDMLAHVVTIREINPFARNGIMRLEDLQHVFRSSRCAPADAQGYLLSLLNKFEAALTWDGRTLLIPSLLPSEELLRSGLPGADVRVPIRSRSWGLRSKGPQSVSRPPGAPPVPPGLHPGVAVPQGDVPRAPSLTPLAADADQPSIQRLLVLSYLPSGFWARLITRVLADDLVVEALRSYFACPPPDKELLSLLSGRRAEWVCWQTGLELRYLDAPLLRVREVLPHLGGAKLLSAQLKVEIEGHWSRVDTSGAVVVEVVLPCHRLRVDGRVLRPSRESTSKLLSLAVDHMDTLLEDWYPTLGTRFVHTSEGRFLVTRLVPCPECVLRAPEPEGTLRAGDLWQLSEGAHWGDRGAPRAGSGGSSDSGVDSQGSSMCGPTHSRKPSMEGFADAAASQQSGSPQPPRGPAGEEVVYGFMVEQCILSAYERKMVTCPDHGDLRLAKISPDMVFMDLGERFLISSDNIRRGKMLGRGAFGFVFRATMKQRGSGNFIEVAMKMLQPVDPGYGARHSDTIAYKAGAALS
ncbi:unnamed protein product [Ixodes hexagonus]